MIHIWVNAVSQGSIDTPARQSEMVSRADAERRRHSAGPQGHIEKSAATCLFLVSDEGGFITAKRST
jgi:NAD(P)-dependent dehydrogenase (short-subunit alcohol dehydrogenase family)